MNAAYIRKRNESLNRMWACLAGTEFTVWVLYALDKYTDSTLPLLVVLLPLLPIVAIFLVLAAIIYYVLACEHYANARGSKNPSNYAAMAFLFSLLASVFFIGLAGVHQSFMTAYFGVFSAFALSTLPLKLIPDRGQNSK